MKFRYFALFMAALALSFVLAGQAQAKDKFRVKMKGCLEQGTAPNTFVLTHPEGYTVRNTTGMAPRILARTDEFFVISESDKNLQSDVGKKVKIEGWIYGDKDDLRVVTDVNQDNVTIMPDTGNVEIERHDAKISRHAGRSGFKLTDLDVISDTCP